MRSCREFVAWVVQRADEVRGDPTPRARRELARTLVEGFVPRLPLFGVDLRAWIAPGAAQRPPSTETRYAAWDPCGFHRELIAGGQDEEVLRHLAAAAAAVLARRRFLVWAASMVDWLQGRFHRAHVPESRAEIAGNRAGARVGACLAAYLEGRLSRAALEAELKTLLCAPTQKEARLHLPSQR